MLRNVPLGTLLEEKGELFRFERFYDNLEKAKFGKFCRLIHSDSTKGSFRKDVQTLGEGGSKILSKILRIMDKTIQKSGHVRDKDP